MYFQFSIFKHHERGNNGVNIRITNVYTFNKQAKWSGFCLPIAIRKNQLKTVLFAIKKVENDQIKILKYKKLALLKGEINT